MIIHELAVELGERSYPIFIGQNAIKEAGSLLKDHIASPRAIIITDKQVGKHYLSPLEKSLKKARIRADSITLPAGEETKSFKQLVSLADYILSLQPDRKTTLIALGGGVIGDITGFAASIVLRGLPFIQIPTTLLAMVDSSVGGKTGINTTAGKNLVGSFYQPRCVLADLSTLTTLPEREQKAGYAEIVKYGLLGDASFFDWLSKHAADVIAGNKESQAHAIETSCRMKAAIVAEDEREAGKRALLNLGHSFGHALEAEMGYGEALLHGEAVSIGMVMAARLSGKLGFCPVSVEEQLTSHLQQLGLPTSPRDIHDHWNITSLMKHMQSDKKNTDGGLTLILLRGIGDAFVHPKTDRKAIETLWKECCQ